MVTVITICYNSIQFIEETIKSVISQDYKDVEYIIIDGGSTDGTKEIIKQYANRITYWCSCKDGGIYDAMNKGIDHTTGEWVCFMNSGDTFYQTDVISNIMRLKIPTEVQVLYGDVEMVYTDYAKIQKAYRIETINYRMPFCHQASFVKSRILKQHKFNLQYKIGADYNLFYSLYYFAGKDIFMY